MIKTIDSISVKTRMSFCAAAIPVTPFGESASQSQEGSTTALSRS
ncbi:hypothetical protein M595_0558 [Lyngbya aestuarii BL J]|uniref:Uncharacterized protein n=1 Tax=Lyngbya aestuarii BL J TaxID=1348334 RepID=U7QNC5_9CYAN|nr:hypothetical protein M595_0558 [Lyngbya aestuarii BL J]